MNFKKSITLLAGMTAIMAFTGIAQAETRFAVQDSTGTTDKMVVTDQGFIGVGTGSAAPLAPLHIKNSTPNGTQLFIENTGSVPYASQQSGGLTFFRNNAGSNLPLKDDRLGYFMFGGFDSISNPGTTYSRYASGLIARADDYWTQYSSPSYITLETTAPGSTTRTEKVRITGVGYVGIGTIAPGQRLEVNGGVRLNTTAGRPVCDINKRGTFWVTQKPSGSADSVEVCIKNASDVYIWQSLY